MKHNSRRTDRVTKGEQFFEPDFAIYVNRVSESFSLLEHSHDFVEICYVSEGTGTHYIEDHVIAVKKGDLFYIPIGVSHIFRPASTSPNNTLIVINCIFREQLRFQDDLWSDISTWKQIKERGHEFGDIMNTMHRENNSKFDGYKIVLYALLLQLLILVKRELSETNHRRPADRRIELALAFIQDHLNESLTLTQVSHHAELGERQLQRIIKKALGQTFTQWLQEQRLIRGCELLQQTQHSISEIMQRVGFQDLKHFHRLFKRKMGVSPGQYRKKQV
jgi:AraC family L-rhamnose operon transcriptional activator RhaR